MPSQYREFLKINNGGVPDKTWFNEMVDVSEFLGVGVANDFDLVEVYSIYQARIPDGFLPVAQTEGGNLILLSASEGDQGVYFWDHEEELEDEDGEAVAPDASEPIASSFSELLARLNTPPPAPEAKGRVLWADPDFLREIEGS